MAGVMAVGAFVVAMFVWAWTRETAVIGMRPQRRFFRWPVILTVMAVVVILFALLATSGPFGTTRELHDSNGVGALYGNGR